MEKRTDALREQAAAINVEIKNLRTHLTQLNSSLTTADLRTEVAAMQGEKAEIEARLQSLRSGSVKPVTKEEKERIDTDLKLAQKCGMARRKIVKDMWAMICEAVPKDKIAELKEALDITI